MIYYYGSKEGLYLSALEAVFENLVAREREIKIEDLDPAVAIEAIINLKIDYYLENPQFVSFFVDGEFLQGPPSSKVEKARHVQSDLDRSHHPHSQTRPAQRPVSGGR